MVRHGETEWSKSGQHTGISDLPLTERGEQAARRVGRFLARTPVDQVFCSPLQRARRTAELAGITDPVVDPELVEWDYGDYEGRTRAQVREQDPDWTVWKDGAPGGESPQQVSDRVDGLIGKYAGLTGRVLLVAHGHVLRALGARWIGEPVQLGEHLPLDTATLSILGYDRGLPVLQRWNCELS
jgi:broad specificity phosphatase PhoE